MDIKFPKFKKKFKKNDFQVNPNLYWKIILALMFIMILGAFCFGYYIFRETNKEPILPTESDSKQAKLINKERINGILKYFSKRKEISTEIIFNTFSSVVDPSL